MDPDRRHTQSPPLGFQGYDRPPLPANWEYATAHTPFHGRVRETQILMDKWQAARSGASEAVVLTGTAGIGKSRFVAEYLRALGLQRQFVHLLKCDQHRDEPFSLFTDWLRREIVPTDVTDISAWFARTFGWTQEQCDFISYLLLAEDSARDEIAKQPAFYVQQKLTQQLLLLVCGLTEKYQPSLWVIEDLHWLDDYSRAVISQLCASPPAGSLILLTTRPGTDLSNLQAETCALSGLSANHIRELLKTSLAQDRLNSEQCSRGISRADGNPLFAESLASLLQNTNGLDVDIPASLMGLLSRRLECLNDLASVLMTAAVIGREFDADSLAQLLDTEFAVLDEQLRDLCRQHLIDPLGADRYRFRHYLIYQAAYLQLNPHRRRQLHQHLAGLLEARGDDPALYRSLDLHWLAAGRPDRAIRYRLLNCDRMIALSSYQDAFDYNDKTLTYFENGLVHDAGQHIECLHKQGRLLMMLKGYGNEEIVECSRKAIELAKLSKNLESQYQSHLALWFTSSSRSGHVEAVKEGKILLDIGRRLDDLPMQAQAHYCMGNGYFFMGKFDVAEEMFLRAVELADEGYDAHVDLFGEHAGILSQSFLAWLDQFKYNDLEYALSRLDKAEARARELKHNYSLAFPLGFRIMLLSWLDRFDLIDGYLQEQQQHAAEYHLAFWGIAGSIIEQLCLIQKGQSQDSSRIAQNIEQIRQVIPGHLVTFTTFQIKALAMLERWQELSTVIEVTLSDAELRKDRYQLAEIYYQRSLNPMEWRQERGAAQGKVLAHESGRAARRQEDFIA